MEENCSQSALHAGNLCEVADIGNDVNITNMSNEQQEVESAKVQHGGNEVLSDISLVDQLESELAEGQIVASMDEAYELYCSYARAKGFSVRKGEQGYFTRTSELKSKEFHCSCEGKKNSSSKFSARTNCKAFLRIARERGGEWKVSRFITEHNHEMLKFHKPRLFGSSRNISQDKRSTLETMENAGIGVVNITNMSKEQEEVGSAKVQHDGNGVLSDVSLVDQLESELAVGRIVTSVDEAYELYCSYAHAKGFSVKKGDQNYFNRSRELKLKEFQCSCEGKKKSRSGLSDRTNCKAFLRITRERGREWKVSRFVTEHNHEMFKFHKTLLMRSFTRNISQDKSSTLGTMENAGIRVVNTTNMSKEQQQVESAKVQHDGNEALTDISLVDKLESELAVGQVMTSVDEAYELYCSYAHAKGFSVRKGEQSYFSRTSELKLKEFKCSCEGQKNSKNKLLVRPRSSIRTNCKAFLRITRERGGDWKVSRFVKEHNHEMLNISQDTSSTLESMENAGICVGNNHLDRLKKHTEIGNGGAPALIQYFIHKSNKEMYFYWNVQVDDDGRIINFFYRDNRCLVDYEYFGDVILVDSIYRARTRNLVCVHFVGINHHKQNVMFGLALMSDGTESSFEWLFRTFLDSMNGKQPETIFSDKCQPMINAIETVFQESHHCLYHLHINQDVSSYLGNLHGDRMFQQLWHKCMSKCDSEEEFEATWKLMTDDYDLSGHDWLTEMYKIRYKWATAFCNDKFGASLSLATFARDNTNSALKKAARTAITLYDVVLNFEKILNSWRTAESHEDTRRLKRKPSPSVKGHQLLDQVADIYTLQIYKMFEMELLEIMNTIIVGQPLAYGDHGFEFKVQSAGESSTIKQVVFDKQTCVIKCSCHKFETMGILCKHALSVLNSMNVFVLPEQYIKRRWTKNANKKVLDEVGEPRCANKDTHSDSLVVEDSNQLDDVLIPNPQCVKTPGISDSSLVCDRDKSERGKGKVSCSNTKATKRMRLCAQEEATHVQISQEVTHVHISQGTSNATPPQGPTGSSVQFLPFASHPEINQSQPCVSQYPMQDSANIHVGVFTDPSGYPYPPWVFQATQR